MKSITIGIAGGTGAGKVGAYSAVKDDVDKNADVPAHPCAVNIFHRRHLLEIYSKNLVERKMPYTLLMTTTTKTNR